MTDFMRVKNENPQLNQSEIRDQPGYSTSTLQRYRNHINMLSPERIQPKITNNGQKRLQLLILTTMSFLNMTSKDLKWPQMTSNDLKRPQSISESSLKVKPVKSKNKLKGDANNEFSDQYLDEFLH